MSSAVKSEGQSLKTTSRRVRIPQPSAEVRRYPTNRTWEREGAYATIRVERRHVGQVLGNRPCRKWAGFRCVLRPSGYQRPNPGKFFDTAAKATAEFDKLIREKAKKGYVEVATNGKPAAPVATPAAASITTGTATGTTTELPDEDRIFWDTTLARRAWAVRGHPLPAGQPMPSSDALAQELTKSWRASQIRHQLPAYLAKDNISLSEATEIYVHCYALTIDLEAVRHGVPFALAVIANAGQPPHSGHGYGRLRTLIAALPEDEYR